ncbi:MAG: DNA polymerase-3 subunit alpha [Parvicella sp.]|jgi:DNA polymerase-3 subunit alpha
MYLIFDTETTGLPKNFKAPITDTDNWPRCVQIAWQLHDDMGRLIEAKDYLIKPDGYDIPFQSEQIHGISTALAEQQGIEVTKMLKEFAAILKKAKFVVGQNITFDLNVMGCELYRYGVKTNMSTMPMLDTCTEVTASMCQIQGGRGGKFKLPTLTELHKQLFNVPFGEAHNATADVEATTRCFLELIRIKSFKEADLQVDEQYFDRFLIENPSTIKGIGLTHLNLKAESEKIRKESGEDDEVAISDEVLKANLKRLKDVRFTHLHCHSQFSILQSTTKIDDLVAAAARIGSPAVALTDTDNMMAAFHFVNAGVSHNKAVEGKIKAIEELIQQGYRIVKEEESEEEKEVALTSEDIDNLRVDLDELEETFVKTIVGSELSVCKDRFNKSVKDNGHLVPFLAKNKKGYHNLSKLASAAHVEGKYYVPRIDKNIIPELKGDIIVTTGGLNGDIPQLILNVGEAQAEEAFVWWKEQFGEDFYVELNRHGLEEEDLVNKVLMKFAKKYDVKYFAANNNFYINQNESESHDLLLCVRDGERKSTPKGRGRGFRFGFPNDDFYFKTQEEMKKAFADLPEAIECTQEIVDKIEPFTLGRDVLLPAFDIPDEHKDPADEADPKLKNGENAYLRHLTYEGAKMRYGEITDEIRERLDFELSVIRNTGYPGYFLIVQDFIQAARDMGVSVGPGRGSAAGSAVAYCTKITNIDPIKYDLLFERFLNPERVSMPDIDIDFDDEGRGRVIQWVIDKYGSNQVAQIITYGTMAAKSSIRDAGRVLDLPLPDTDRIAKLVPDMKLNKLFKMDEEVLAEKLDSEQMKMALELKDILKQRGIEGEVLRQARTIEGSMRTTGIHACGVIITPSDIREHVPVALAKDSNMWCTQFDNSVVEDAGLLKMDFLGLKTLTLIKETLKIVKARHDIEIDIELIPIDDELTYELFQRGETVGIFQYESPGMQKHLKDLKPTAFSDLIAMNALYRPGPIEYIPNFIARKHGNEEIKYDLDAMEDNLKETYGITVYQEQVMLLSQKLADFTKGEADTLRKAMGKKQKSVLDKMKPKFLDRGEGKGHSRKVLEKVWKDWEAFASYAFNKSHSTCYAWIAYQTAYLKAHYPAEYMAAVLSNNMNDIKTVSFFMEEARRMGLNVLGPDVNESFYKFAVNDKGEVRFGMGGMKGVGAGPVKSIVAERKENGNFKSIFDMVRRVSLKDCNKRVLEGLAYGGALDQFTDIKRPQYFQKDEKDRSLIENCIKYGAAFQNSEDSDQVSMFDMAGVDEVEMPTPKVQDLKEWTVFEELSYEKEVVGIYISGHPMDDYKLEVDNFCDIQLNLLSNRINELPNKEFSCAGIISNMAHLESRKGNKYGFFELQDMSGSMEFRIFGETYLKLSHFLTPGNFLYVKGNVQLKGKKFNPDGKQKEFSVQMMELLTNVRERMLKSVYLQFDGSQITQNTITELEEIFNMHPGSHNVYMDLADYQELSSVTLISRHKKVNVSNDFLREMREVPGFEGFSVNKSMMGNKLHRMKLEQLELSKINDNELVEE